MPQACLEMVESFRIVLGTCTRLLPWSCMVDGNHGRNEQGISGVACRTARCLVTFQEWFVNRIT